jgi:hypothetical protein
MVNCDPGRCSVITFCTFVLEKTFCTLLKSARLNEDSEHAVSAFCGSENNGISNLVSQIGTPPRTKHHIRIVLAQEFVGATKAGRVSLPRGNLKSKSGGFTDEISVRFHVFFYVGSGDSSYASTLSTRVSE